MRGRILAVIASAGTLVGAFPAARAEKARALHLTTEGEPIVVLVPKMFAPLLDGSFYPNRRKVIPAAHCPVAIVGPKLKSLHEYLLARGFLVVEVPDLGGSRIKRVIHALEGRSEADSRRIVAVARGSVPAECPIPHAIIFEPILSGAAVSSFATLDLFFCTPGREPSESLSRKLHDVFGIVPVEKWYRAEKDFPEQAYRDAAECAAEAIAR